MTKIDFLLELKNCMMETSYVQEGRSMSIDDPTRAGVGIKKLTCI